MINGYNIGNDQRKTKTHARDLYNFLFVHLAVWSEMIIYLLKGPRAS